jgi:hypothetical protein
MVVVRDLCARQLYFVGIVDFTIACIAIITFIPYFWNVIVQWFARTFNRPIKQGVRNKLPIVITIICVMLFISGSVHLNISKTCPLNNTGGHVNKAKVLGELHLFDNNNNNNTKSAQYDNLERNHSQYLTQFTAYKASEIYKKNVWNVGILTYNQTKSAHLYEIRNKSIIDAIDAIPTMTFQLKLSTDLHDIDWLNMTEDKVKEFLSFRLVLVPCTSKNVHDCIYEIVETLQPNDTNYYNVVVYGNETRQSINDNCRKTKWTVIVLVFVGGIAIWFNDNYRPKNVIIQAQKTLFELKLVVLILASTYALHVWLLSDLQGKMYTVGETISHCLLH